MNNTDFLSHIGEVQCRIASMLKSKGDEYAPNADRLENFVKGAQLLKCTKEGYLLGLVTKHYIALTDFIAQLEIGIDCPYEQWIEKTSDIINYMVLLEAIIQERKKAIDE